MVGNCVRAFFLCQLVLALTSVADGSKHLLHENIAKFVHDNGHSRIILMTDSKIEDMHKMFSTLAKAGTFLVNIKNKSRPINAEESSEFIILTHTKGDLNDSLKLVQYTQPERCMIVMRTHQDMSIVFQRLTYAEFDLHCFVVWTEDDNFMVRRLVSMGDEKSQIIFEEVKFQSPETWIIKPLSDLYGMG